MAGTLKCFWIHENYNWLTSTVLKCETLATQQRHKFVKGFCPAPFYAMQRRDYNCFMFFSFLLSANNYYRANGVCLGRK